MLPGAGGGRGGGGGGGRRGKVDDEEECGSGSRGATRPGVGSWAMTMAVIRFIKTIRVIKRTSMDMSFGVLRRTKVGVSVFVEDPHLGLFLLWTSGNWS